MWPNTNAFDDSAKYVMQNNDKQMRDISVASKMKWESPKSRSIGLFTDLRLFSEALELASQHEYITTRYLIEELAQRVKGLLPVERQSSRGMKDLIRECKGFGWLRPIYQGVKPIDAARYRITPEGEKASKLFHENERHFLRRLTAKMQGLYVIPGWFVYRLWTINPKGQGEVIIPAPHRDWSTRSREWEDNVWTNELSEQSERSLNIAKTVCTGAFPIEAQEWIGKVRKAWDRLSNLKQRKVAKPPLKKLAEEKGRMKTYKPRLRLAMAMREAAVKHLFSNKPPNCPDSDFNQRKDPLAPRTYMAWCPRLEALEFIFYTDVHPSVPGRLIFPTSVFREDTPTKSFERLDDISSPDGKRLCLHRPSWEVMRERFSKTLVQEHQNAYTRGGSLYVPLLDLRDEVCRQLRLSAASFDDFMERALRESLKPESKLSVSVETDIREDQRSAHRLIRRPVLLGGTPHSLIAITEIQNT